MLQPTNSPAVEPASAYLIADKYADVDEEQTAGNGIVLIGFHGYANKSSTADLNLGSACLPCSVL